MTTAFQPSTDARASTTIAAADLQELQRTDPTVRLLDVRTSAEFESAHITGSHNVPLDMLDDHLLDLVAVDAPVVLICQSGGRATQACSKLQGAGKNSLRVLDGGISSWETLGADVVRGTTERWAMERQVHLVAGSIALAGVAASTIVPGAKWLAGGVAAGLTFSAVSNTCTMATVLAKLPYNQSPGPDIDVVLADLNAGSS